MTYDQLKFSEMMQAILRSSNMLSDLVRKAAIANVRSTPQLPNRPTGVSTISLRRIIATPVRNTL